MYVHPRTPKLRNEVAPEVSEFNLAGGGEIYKRFILMNNQFLFKTINNLYCNLSLSVC